MTLSRDPILAHTVQFEISTKTYDAVELATDGDVIGPDLSTLFDIEHLSKMIANAVHISAKFHRRRESRIRS
jgi:hypothetical protein